MCKIELQIVTQHDVMCGAYKKTLFGNCQQGLKQQLYLARKRQVVGRVDVLELYALNYSFSVPLLTRRALGRAHVPPTKVF